MEYRKQTRLFYSLLSAALLLSLPFGTSAQTADAWPSKPIRWIVPFPPGGAMDVIARAIGPKISQTLGQAVVIENKAGAGGNIGADFVAKSPNDGHTIMITSIGMATNRFLYPKLSYDPVRDFAPVSLLAIVPNVLVTNAEKNTAQTVSDVVAMARTNPGKLTYASAGNGTSIHLAGEVFASIAKVDMVHVPYRGGAPAMTDLLGGQVNYMFDSITSAKPHIQSGKLRPLAITTAKRSSALPHIPTMAEAGITGYEVSPWFAVFTTAGTGKSTVSKLNAALLDAMKQPDIKAKFESIGAESIGSSPEELTKHLELEITRWGKVINERRITAD